MKSSGLVSLSAAILSLISCGASSSPVWTAQATDSGRARPSDHLHAKADGETSETAQPMVLERRTVLLTKSAYVRCGTMEASILAPSDKNCSASAEGHLLGKSARTACAASSIE